MRVVVIGGHMAPAIGFIDKLPKGTEVIYIGREHVFEGDTGISLEQQAIQKKRIPFTPLQAGRLQRVLTKHTISSLLKVPGGFTQSLKLLKKEKPDVVVGFGGYLSVPVGVAASLLGIPLVIHESTMAAGLANKVLAPLAHRICISWESSRPYFPKEKTVLTGNPLLPFTTKIPDGILPKSQEKLPLLFISGGSGGSHAINTFILEILPELLEITKIVHQTGDAKEYNDYEKLIVQQKKLPKKIQNRYSVVKFIDPEDINAIFAKADLLIGRSGINTVATLLTLNKKAILIPLPVGQKDEQLSNAQLLESEGLGVILQQKTLSPKLLFETIKKVLTEKTLPSKWHIPVAKNGAENVVTVVMSCQSQKTQEN